MTGSSTQYVVGVSLGTARERLWAAVRTGDEPRATVGVLDAVEVSGDAETVLLDLIARCPPDSSPPHPGARAGGAPHRTPAITIPGPGKSA